MLSLPPSVRIHVATEPADMRKSFNGLSVLVDAVLEQDPMSGHLFVFRNRRGDRLKILYWDRSGFFIWYKLLEKGSFHFPASTGSDGRQVRRLRLLHSRPYQSIFGSFDLNRVVYGTREGQRIELAPLDQRLQFPEGKFSYLLQDWDQSLSVEKPYTQVSATLEKMLGFSQSVDTLERMNRKMAEPVVDYWNSLEPPLVSEEGELIVASADCKGVVMRRPAMVPPIEGHQEKSGPRPGSKKMALVGATYTVDRYERTPEQVLEALFRRPADNDDRTHDRPRPQHKRVRASLERCEEDTMEPAFDEIIGWMALEIEQRNALGEKPLLILMDGEKSLWNAAKSLLPESVTEILDLLHVTPRLWKAAYLFHPKGSADAARFVRERTLRILQGEVISVLRGLRRMATLSGLSGRKRKQLERLCGYFEANSERMRYDEYLAEGYPIATGIIEGACRHLVKDRLERTGMTWVPAGTQAMLDLRSIHLGEQWDEFTAFRIRKEIERLYPLALTTDESKWRVAA